MAHVKLRDRDDVDPELFADRLRQARAIELGERDQGDSGTVGYGRGPFPAAPLNSEPGA